MMDRWVVIERLDRICIRGLGWQVEMMTNAENGMQSGRPLASAQPAFGRKFRASLIDRGYQLEISLTPCRIIKSAISNRRWTAISPIQFLNPSFGSGI
jgi:hypothetical protein